MKLFAQEQGWRFRRTVTSLSEVHRSAKVPKVGGNWLGILRKLFAFSGWDFLVAVGYMDPGTGPQELAEVAQFYYTLSSVGIISRLMAIFLTN